MKSFTQICLSKSLSAYFFKIIRESNPFEILTTLEGFIGNGIDLSQLAIGLHIYIRGTLIFPFYKCESIMAKLIVARRNITMSTTLLLTTH